MKRSFLNPLKNPPACARLGASLKLIAGMSLPRMISEAKPSLTTGRVSIGRSDAEKKVVKEQIEKRKVTFKVRAPGARKVHLAGEFNDWNPDTHPMEKDEEGFWKIGLRLAPGKYEYKLRVDGRWWEDIEGGHFVPSPFGTFNKVLFVPERQPASHLQT